MERAAERLKYWLRTVPEQFGRLSEAEVSERPMPGKWSPKEALGHLCDSAVNNLHRFIKIQYEKQPYVLIPYDQDQWVALQDYQNTPAEEILNLWSGLNNRILKVIEKIPAEKLSSPCVTGNQETKSLQWLIDDYVEHMEYHLNRQILKNNV
ncbi:DinB superfamily protein [Paenibacillus tianmuensis]|uniref:DinB superfamily protein n=1 Tax=Paenibacillus tianmuensis TaxID=624147 RepID=A0A1G4SZ41_9BACL|nr:DinB family protein [Paenibacillus tianmuensis]SCW74460.1 DinB superfamily protein [Paenibacillus tianmuensis]